MLRHDDDESWVEFTWMNTWAAKVMDMDYMDIFDRWTDGTLFTMSNLDIGWMSSLWDFHIFAEWALVMALMANTSRLTNALDMMRHGSSWWSCIHWRLHSMVILEYLTHWGAEVGMILILMQYGMHTLEHIYGVCLGEVTWWGRSSQDTLEFDGDAAKEMPW